MAAHPKSHQRRDEFCAGGLRKRAWNTARSFFDSDGAAVLNVRARLVIGFMEQHIVELSPINHFSALRTLVAVPFLRFAQLVKGASLAPKAAADK
jgi:hypothetical protein